MPLKHVAKSWRKDKGRLDRRLDRRPRRRAKTWHQMLNFLIEKTFETPIGRLFERTRQFMDFSAGSQIERKRPGSVPFVLKLMLLKSGGSLRAPVPAQKVGSTPGLQRATYWSQRAHALRPFQKAHGLKKRTSWRRAFLLLPGALVRSPRYPRPFLATHLPILRAVIPLRAFSSRFRSASTNYVLTRAGTRKALPRFQPSRYMRDCLVGLPFI
jgi:hypothetical protein